MASAWETEDEYAAAAAAAAAASLPTPTDTPYRTPSRGSRRSSRHKSLSQATSSSPPLLPVERSRHGSRDVAKDESISILDPRRFTPTLHASLVSEILSLRRDQEDKTKTIESLEVALHESRGVHQQLEETLETTGKETRSLKRQLTLLEGGTSSALTELAKERDEAVDSTAELRRRFEAAQKKIRSQEEDAKRVYDLWGGDKDNWKEEKIKFERRIHVTEGRLKAVLDEFTAYQANDQKFQQQQLDTETEDVSRDPVHGNGSDTASVRSMSMTNSIRFSMLNGPNGYGVTKLNGISLADELNFDENEDLQTDHEGRESVLSLQQEQSHEGTMSRHHHRNQSIDSLMRPGSVARGKMLVNQAVLERLEGEIQEDDEIVPPTKVKYIDTGVQYSPPPSSKIEVIEPVAVIEPLLTNGVIGAGRRSPEHEQSPREWEIEANQQRKRMHAHPPLVIDAPMNCSMVSAVSETLEDPLSPPRTPISPIRAPPSPPSEDRVPEMISSCTQMDAPDIQSLRRAPPPAPIPIIQLHPPSSAPATPREPLLPQHFKDVACQVSMRAPVPMKSVSVQTEEIRVDKRLIRLPPHLQPSAISSNPPSPEPVAEDVKLFSPNLSNLPPRNPRRVIGRPSLEQEFSSSPPQVPSFEIRDAYPGNNDDGPLAKDKGSIRRPHRISSLFAGFGNVSSDDADEFADADMSDNDYRTALSAPKPISSINSKNKPVYSESTSVPRNFEFSEVSTSPPTKNSIRQTGNYDMNGDYVLPEAQAPPQSITGKAAVRQLNKPLTLVTNMKPGTMRRSALIQSGVAAHMGRSRSPSLAESVKEPPFPIPTRESSRRPPISASAPSDGSRSPTWGRGSSRGLYRANSIRKVRSAAALSRGGGNYRRRRSRSPPPMSASTEAPESPQMPPMPNNEITTPRFMRDTSTSRYRTHKKQPSANTANTANTGTASVGSSNQATSVVDAIAQTMVGEWMFKYVRRRKSFGMTEPSGAEGDSGNGVRHRRWVWLAPYERAVMWSSKQPTSGPALLGKSGRKLIISSVLDVKDDSPPPKGTASLFNRSILILTPGRALKFTAISPERHYIWLTALSFLAHSSQAVPDVVAAPIALPQPALSNFEAPSQGARRRKHNIRDSIRVAKGKTALAGKGPTSVHSSQQGDQSIRHTQSFYTTHTEPAAEAADPPIVPRFSERGERGYHAPPLVHTRKRSNTASRIPPPLSFRGVSGGVTAGHGPTASSAMSVGTTVSSDIYNQSQQSSSGAGYPAMSFNGRSSIRTSDASARPGAVVSNFFDAVGTMRMEAFIGPMALSRFDECLNEQDEMDTLGMHQRSRDRRRGSRARDSFYSGKSRTSDDWYGGSKTAGEEEYGHFDNGVFDPFRGF